MRPALARLLERPAALRLLRHILDGLETSSPFPWLQLHKDGHCQVIRTGETVDKRAGEAGRACSRGNKPIVARGRKPPARNDFLYKKNSRGAVVHTSRGRPPRERPKYLDDTFPHTIPRCLQSAPILSSIPLWAHEAGGNTDNGPSASPRHITLKDPYQDTRWKFTSTARKTSVRRFSTGDGAARRDKPAHDKRTNSATRHTEHKGDESAKNPQTRSFRPVFLGSLSSVARKINKREIPKASPADEALADTMNARQEAATASSVSPSIDNHKDKLREGGPRSSSTSQSGADILSRHNRAIAALTGGTPKLYDADTRRELAEKILSRENVNRSFLPFIPRDPKEVWNDGLIARLFATRAFSTTTVINFISMIGLQTIGSLSMREMMTRELRTCLSPPRDPFAIHGHRAAGAAERLSEQIYSRLEDLKRGELAIDPSHFNKILLCCATQKRLFLLRWVIDSDFHHDVYADTPLMHRLLEQNVMTGDAKNARCFAMVLTLFEEDSSQASSNLLLQVHTKFSNLAHVLGMLDEMRANNHQLTTESISHLQKSIMRPRRTGKRPVTFYRLKRGVHDDLRTMKRILWHISLTDSPVPPRFWQEILKRLGMYGRMKELRDLVFGLAWQHRSTFSRAQAQQLHVARRDGEFAEKAGVLPNAVHPGEREALVQSSSAGGAGPTSMWRKVGHANARSWKNWQTQTHRWHPLRRILTPAMQKAIIDWGFRTGILQEQTRRESIEANTCTGSESQHGQLDYAGNELNCSGTSIPPANQAFGIADSRGASAGSLESPLADIRQSHVQHRPWTAGISILRKLLQRSRSKQTHPIERAPGAELGPQLPLVYINPNLVRGEVTQRLWVLCSPGYRSHLRHNRRARRIVAMKGWKLETLVRDAEAAWGAPLWPIEDGVRYTLGIGPGKKRVSVDQSDRADQAWVQEHIRQAKVALWITVFGSRPWLNRRKRIRISESVWMQVLERTV